MPRNCEVMWRDGEGDEIVHMELGMYYSAAPDLTISNQLTSEYGDIFQFDWQYGTKSKDFSCAELRGLDSKELFVELYHLISEYLGIYGERVAGDFEIVDRFTIVWEREEEEV